MIHFKGPACIELLFLDFGPYPGFGGLERLIFASSCHWDYWVGRRLGGAVSLGLLGRASSGRRRGIGIAGQSGRRRVIGIGGGGASGRRRAIGIAGEGVV